MLTHIMKYKLIYLGTAIQLLYFISAFHTAWFNGLFTGNSIHHCCRGMDFYQVPNGAYAFWHGGSLTGQKLHNGSAYNTGSFINDNVYHPLFTLVVGSFFLWLLPNQAFFFWMIVKLVITLIITAYFFWSFREHKYIGLAAFVLLANATQYLEIAIGQYQSLINVFLLLLLINLVKGRSSLWSGIFYCLSLLVKPIGILWIWVFLCKQRFKVALIGCILFSMCTMYFLLTGSGAYYFNNLKEHFLYPSTIGPNQIITLRAFLRYSTPLGDFWLKLIQNTALALVLFFSSLRRVHISKGIFLMVVYYLFFYDYVFEYHYTSLAPVIAVCLLCCPEFQTRVSRFLILLTCLPSAFVLLNLWHIDMALDSFYGLNPGTLGWQWMVLSKIGPVFLLTISVLARDIVPAYQAVKVFWKELCKVNSKMEVFG